MLVLAKSLGDLDFEQLMSVYAESNGKSGGEKDPGEPLSQGRALAERDFYEYLLDFFDTKGALYAVLEKEGLYVSALRLEPFQDGLLVEALETAPDRRGRGWATALLNEVLGLPQCKILYSHVRRRNLASRRVHEKCGFHVCQDFARYVDGSVDANALTYVWRK